MCEAFRWGEFWGQILRPGDDSDSPNSLPAVEAEMMEGKIKTSIVFHEIVRVEAKSGSTDKKATQQSSGGGGKRKNKNTRLRKWEIACPIQPDAVLTRTTKLHPKPPKNIHRDQSTPATFWAKSIYEGLHLVQKQT